MIRRLAFAMALAAALAGCAVGPNYQPPELPTPPTFRDTPEEQASIADLPWWEVFRDDVLQQLVREGLEHNRDLLTAIANVELSRDQAAIARGELFPRADYEGDAHRGKNAFLGVPTVLDSSSGSSYLAALNFFWEVDVWGRIRRATESARAQMLASDAVRRGVVLSLVTDIARAYLELRELDLELEIANRNVENFRETYQLFQRQYTGGVTSRLDPLRGEAALAQAASTVPDIERRIVAKENQLSILVGRPAGGIERGAALTEQSFPPEVPAGVPSQLLLRRPDVIEAEETLISANAQIGVAFAQFFPRIGLTAFRGAISTDLSQMLKSGNAAWSYGSQAVGPIFTWGQNWYNWEAAKANNEASIYQYQQSVLIALADVSDALTAREKVALQRAELERQVEALRESVRLAQVRYVGGLATYLEVLDAQQQLFPAELDLSRALLDERVAIVSIYRALGGGWSQEGEAPNIPSPLRP
ncbi:MAG TPA: efflux transporter outer membrane subunit [Myxococcota bacterium]|nr:efflux transporter outer membrane subunit [Myxococcota bacterium]